MKIRTKNKTRDFIVRKLLGLTYRLENIGNGDIIKSGELAFIKNISGYYKEPIVFFDIGANVGDYAKILKDQRNNPSDLYYAFEPQKSCLNEIEKKFANSGQLILNNVGLSDKETEATIYKDSEKSGLTSLYKRNLDFYKLKMDAEERILLTTAERYIQERGIRKIHFVKIDVEGNEIKTLNGFGPYLNADFIDFIQFEYGGANIDSHTNLMDFYTLLEQRGFKICKMMRHDLEYREYDPRLENFVCQNYVAVSQKISNKLT